LLVQSAPFRGKIHGETTTSSRIPDSHQCASSTRWAAITASGSSKVRTRRTPAAGLPDETAQDDKLAPLQRLCHNQQTKAISDRMVGGRQRILVEHVSKKDAAAAGRTPNTRVMNFRRSASD
jgi:tRNA A37 methylthiotransferase MiaB